MNTIILRASDAAISRLMDGKLDVAVQPDGKFGLPFDEVCISAAKPVDLSNVQLVFRRGGVDMVICNAPAVCVAQGDTLVVSGLSGTLDVRFS